MSSNPATTATTQSGVSKPLGGAQANLFSNIWGDTGNTLRTDLGTPQPGNYTAGATPLQWQGSNQMAGVAPMLGANAGATSDLSQRIASGYYANPWNDPTFGGAVSSVINPAVSTLESQILPSIRDTSLRAGGTGTGPTAYGGTYAGGSPQEEMTNNVLQSWGQNLTNTIGSMANAERNAGLNLMGLVPGLNTSAISSALAPSLATEQAGQLQQGFNQADLTNLLQRYQMQTGAPLNFEQLAATIGGTGGFGGKAGQGTQTGPPPSMATQLLQGITGGAGALNSLFGSGPGGTSAFGNIAGGLSDAGWGALTSFGEAFPEAAATMGEFLPFLLSDRRAKENIEPIGKLADKTPVYKFNYKSGGPTQIGLMSDEVNPTSVYKHSSGLDLVDYDSATKQAARLWEG